MKLRCLSLTIFLGFHFSAQAATKACRKILDQQMTISEVQTAMYGTNPLKPSKDSWIGKYLKETGASTVTRRFPLGPDYPGELGERKLVVAVSEATLPVFNKYFARREILQQFHTPSQGTLMLHFNGKVGSYANQNSEMMARNDGTILPTLLLSTSEGIRAEKFFELAAQSRNQALTPWVLTNYCKRGGYSSCTHWFGNIPIGDKRVDRYVFPGRVDEHADDDVPKAVQRGPLHRYRNGSQLTRQVWKVPGQMQLWEVMGQYRAQVSGYFANPGWVAHVITAWVKPERSPVVFVFVPDHTEPIARDFNLRINAY